MGAIRIWHENGDFRSWNTSIILEAINDCLRLANGCCDCDYCF